jgi:Na+/proline symporter
MVINLELHNGLIKEYPTSYELYDGIGEWVYSTTVSMCNISGSTKCDHLYCAIYAAKETSKSNKRLFKIGLIACLFWFLMPGWSVLSLIYALFGSYSIWQSKKYEKMARELMEFRDHETINGVVAHKL